MPLFQVLMLHKWNRKSNQVETLNACKGHKRSVDCIAVDAARTFIASGSYDAQVQLFFRELL